MSPAEVVQVEGTLPCPSEVGDDDFVAGGIESGDGLLDVLRELDWLPKLVDVELVDLIIPFGDP